ncbi:MAG: PhoU domain-containing protein [Pseudomonadota bacterium]
MKPPKKNIKIIRENFRFIIVEVTKQVEDTLELLENPSQALLEKIYGRDDYIDGLKGLIEDKCFSQIFAPGELSKKSTDLIRAIAIIATNLERIADFAVNVAGQSKYFTQRDFIARYDYGVFFTEVLTALGAVSGAIRYGDSAAALRICRCEATLDELYKVNLDRILEELKTGKEVGNVLTVLFILRYLERMGDSLLNIGEAILYALLGEKLKIRQLEALREALGSSGHEIAIGEMEFESIWGHRSGCRIGIVRNAGSAESGTKFIFKQGKLKKLQQEKERLESWEDAMPGLVPKVVGFHTDGPNASLLLEHLSGCTFQELLGSLDWDIVENALFLVKENVLSLWRSSKVPETFRSDCVEQIRQRMMDVYHIHPCLRTGSVRIGEMEVPSFEELIADTEESEALLSAPFRVLIHGDFNVDNILYDHAKQRVHFIDVHRSELADYVQDVSVFAVSNLRLPVFDQRRRRLLNAVIADFLEFAKNFAQDNGDELFEARLAFGLARSLFTSTRFEFNGEFAKSMHLRAVYILERLRDHGTKPWSEFRTTYDFLFI